MSSEKGASKTRRGGYLASAKERSAVGSEWRKNRPGTPSHGSELDPTLTVLNKARNAFVFAIVIGGVLLIGFLWSAPREVRELKGTIAADAKLDEDGNASVVVAIPGQRPKMMTYRGSRDPRRGQQVIVEEVSNPLFPWTNFRLKDVSR